MKRAIRPSVLRSFLSQEGTGGGSEALEQDRALHLLDRLRDLDASRTRVRTVERRAAPEDPGLLREDLHPFAARLVAGIEDEAVRVDDGCGPHVALVAPEHRARGGARRAQDALRRVVVPVAILRRLPAFLLRFTRVVDQVREDRTV